MNPYAARFPNVIPFRSRMAGPKTISSLGIRAAGQATVSMVDANGDTAQYSGGVLVPGSVRDSEGSPAADSLFDQASAYALSSGASGVTGTTGGTSLNPNVVVNDAAALLNTTASSINQAIASGNQQAIQNLRDQTDITLQGLRNQAAQATAQGNVALAAQTTQQQNALLAFRAQLGSQQGTTTAYVVAGVVIAALVAGVAAVAITSTRGGSRSSARRNPSRRHGRRRSRRGRR